MPHRIPEPSRASTRSKSKSLTIYYQNVRGLRTKTNNLLLSLSACDFDIVVFTETWLHADIASSELSCNYVIYRCDRNASNSCLQRGGGVLIAIKSELNCRAVHLVDSDDLEQTAVRITLPLFSLFVCCIYIRPNSCPEKYKRHVDSVNQISTQAGPRDVIVCLGDYNLPNLVWHFDEEILAYLPINASTEQELALAEAMMSAGFYQVNDLLNVNGKLLDLVFVSDQSIIDLFESPYALLKVDAHHKPFILTVDACSRDEDSSATFTSNFDYDFNNCDYEELNARIASIDWQIVLNHVSIDDAVSAFYSTIHHVIQSTVPVRPRRNSKQFSQPWWTPQLRNLRNRLRKIRKRFLRHRNASNMRELKHAEEEYNLQQRNRFREYTDSLQENFRQNPSSFWSYINKRKSSSRVPVDVNYRSRVSCSPVATANLFADFFRSVHNDVTPQLSQQYLDSLPAYNFRVPQVAFSNVEILEALSTLDASKGPGPDMLPPVFIKQCAHSLSLPVTSIFNRSLIEGVFPDAWKLASITPIHKGGNMNNVENYRPISILNCLAKVFESLIHGILYPVVQHAISEYQHGFVRKRSTTTNLMSYTHSIINHLEKRNQVDAIYIDFAKAFDKVPHELAIEKLSRLGLPFWVIQWLKSYLSSRKAFVKVHDARSNVFDIPSGVPQGSHLGPLIFILYINDLCETLNSSKLLYADDLKLFRVIKSLLDCCALQADIRTVSRWCEVNGMQMNVSKCKVITFTRRQSIISFDYSLDNTSLEKVRTIKDLGVTLDSKLRFNEHISVTTAKANAMLGFLRRNTSQFDNVYALKSLYCALVRSILEYGVQIWAPYHAVHIERIERVQKRFLRFALRGLPWNDPVNLPPYENRCALIGLQPLASRRVMLQRLFTFDVIRNNIDCSSLLENVRLHVPIRQL